MCHCVNSNIGKWVETRADYQDISELVCRVNIRGFIENEGVLSEASATNLIGEIGGILQIRIWVVATSDPHETTGHARVTAQEACGTIDK